MYIYDYYIYIQIPHTETFKNIIFSANYKKIKSFFNHPRVNPYISTIHINSSVNSTVSG